MIKNKSNLVWTDEDYSQLGWSMSRLYGLILPGRQHCLSLQLDYVLESPLRKTTHGVWKVAPAKLDFFDVIDLKIKMKQRNFSEVTFVSLERSNMRPTPNGKLIYWDYRIEFSPDALIEFTSTGFRQLLIGDVETTEFQDLDREMSF